MARIAFLFLLSIPHYSYAQSLEEQRLQSKSKINILNDVTLDTNTQKVDAFDFRSGVTYTLGLKYRVRSKDSLWVFGRLSKRFTGEERFDLLDTIARYELGLGKFKGFSNRLRVSAVLPTNEFLHERTSFSGALSGQLRAGVPLAPKLYLLLAPTLRWNFHEFRVTEQAVPNVQSNLTLNANLSYALGSKVNLSSTLSWGWAKTYKNIFKSNYNFNLSASYMVTSKWTITGGYTTGALSAAADGRGHNIEFFDERNTNYYFSLTHFY